MISVHYMGKNPGPGKQITVLGQLNECKPQLPNLQNEVHKT